MKRYLGLVRLRYTLALWLLGGLLVSCGSGEKPEKTFIAGFWSIDAVNGDRQHDELVEEGDYGAGASASYDFGPLVVYPPDKGANAEAEVYVSESGETYWASAESTALKAGEPIGSNAFLAHVQGYRKTAEDATLSFVISETLLEAIDDSAQSVTCPWVLDTEGAPDNDCKKLMYGSVDFELQVNLSEEVGEPVTDVFYNVSGRASLLGFRGFSEILVYTKADSTDFLWNRSNFDFVQSDPGRFQARLASPITLEIPIDLLPIGATFDVGSVVKARAFQTRSSEAYMGAYFRDPVHSDGLNVRYTGLEPIPPSTDKLPEPATPEPILVCDTPDPAAGILEFESASFKEPELPGSGAEVVVTRTGGSRGKVSARFSTSDDSARAGADYEAVNTFVLFADGEEGSRVVDVPLVIDQTAEPDKTLKLTLSDPGGCAALGEQSKATLTIMDDDRPADPGATYSVGGTVTGLLGSGLVLTNLGEEITPGNGPFVFSNELPGGASIPYNVQVKTQPSNPVQVCTVTNGAGRLEFADITNVLVSCAIPSAGDEALDPGFGVGGKVNAGLPGGATDLALQQGGKIVAVGGTPVDGAKLARYLEDGSLDPGFGTGGVAGVVFLGEGYDLAKGVAVQNDGKIVVVGQTRRQTNDVRSLDWAVARYLTNGTLDTSFGPNGDGKIITDFGSSPTKVSLEGAEAVAIQPDGKIVVAGVVSQADAVNQLDSDFVLVRYLETGSVDSGFGGGSVRTNIGGKSDVLSAVALQPDGKIVAAGRVADGGGDDPDIGLARYNASGSLDPGFGTGGILQDETEEVWDEAADLVIQPDGKIVVAGLDTVIVQQIGRPRFLLARYDGSGKSDQSFGNAGRVNVGFANDARATAVALQNDGDIMSVGYALGSDNLGNFVIARHDTSGTPDSGFGTNGTLTVDFFGGGDSAEAVLVQPDGKIVVGGVAVNGTQQGLGLVRVLP